MPASALAMIHRLALRARRPVTHAKKVLTPFHADATRVVLPDGTSESSQLNVAR
jgi:hypothetical protein